MAQKNPSNLTRKEIIAAAYKNAVKNKWHVSEAAAWASKEHGHRINKGDIQYYAMKAKLPYIDELKNGIRLVVI
jgi:Asp-tRNA(Asn)/Glu-tRNA(Gln) amidotransferase B subunit